MGRLLSGILLNYWTLLVVKIVLKHMVHFFKAYRVDFGCNWDTSSPLPITKTAAVFGVLDVLLRLSLRVPGFSGTVRKSLYWDLVRISLIFVNYVAYSFGGVNLDPLRPVEKFSHNQKRSSTQYLGRLFSGIILLNYWSLLVVKTVLKHMVHFLKACRVDFGCN